jgi:hypothetical protein
MFSQMAYGTRVKIGPIGRLLWLLVTHVFSTAGEIIIPSKGVRPS